MSAPTPGPWEVAHGGTGRPGAEITEYFVRRPGNVCSIAADIIDPTTYQPSEANACLIAAAPDLLAACEALVALDTDEGCRARVAASRARAAIAKARGAR